MRRLVGRRQRDGSAVRVGDLARRADAGLQSRCATAGCHVGAGAPFGLDLSAGLTAGNTINVPASEIPSLMRVEPGDSADSYLYMKVIDDPRILGDRMPGGGGALSAADLELIRDWIDQGAQ